MIEFLVNGGKKDLKKDVAYLALTLDLEIMVMFMMDSLSNEILTVSEFSSFNQY